MTPQRPGYLPPDLVGELDMAMSDGEFSTWTAARLLERAYAQGYADGHLRGRREAAARQEAVKAAAKAGEASVP